MKSQLVPVLLNLLASFAGAGGQWLYKSGSARLKETPLWQNFQLLGGVILFTLVMVLFIVAFRLGGRISVTFPVYALTFVWGTLLGVLIDKEPFAFAQGAGILLVVAGVIMVATLSPQATS